ncbi:MAG: hypothetical protein ABR574_12610 [Cryomorphaceae bacterium]|nr:hypothetical protein [Flavobacteriales bacterium]
MKKSRILLALVLFLAVVFVLGGFLATRMSHTDEMGNTPNKNANQVETGTQYELPQVIPTAWLRGQ